ncbi:Vta1 like-domain-containing protein [Mycotypha africana]|uniref:Vta1 like-domain-containing protein n=1 Tax=Mycotypha africana TaxID=64632 RepID=UPI0023011E67|nr:Vta1 like-domain-containing protein [Mycotypha africana]KAI8984716.1 Vta1 like-domain-containing protein [Mycotypha africana]
MNIPTDLKYITPYIQRGQELLSRDPILSYYARYYAAKLAIARGPRTKETNAYLSDLLDALETQKQDIGDNEAITNDIVAYAYVENFALKIFLNADNEDRAGKANKKTAKTFLAASIFLELLKTFGDLDPEVEAKIKYSKWKAADIMKALREGPEQQIPSSTHFDQNNLPAISDFPDPPLTSINSDHSATTASTQYPSSSIKPSTASANNNTFTNPQTQLQTEPQTQFQPQSHSQPTSVNTPQQSSLTVEASKLDAGTIARAQKYCKWAISALDYEDTENARLQLLKALNEMGYNRNNNFGF